MFQGAFVMRLLIPKQANSSRNVMNGAYRISSEIRLLPFVSSILRSYP
jgi:hypothetical protein